MTRSRSGSLDSLGRRRRRTESSRNHRRRRPSISRSRSRSRSPSRGRRRSRRSLDRRRRSYSRSRSRSRRPSVSRTDGHKPEPAVVEEKQHNVAPNALTNLSEEEQLKLLLGIDGFNSSKGKMVEENLKSAATGAARRGTKRDYRQYMNRRGGFNRPLDKS